MKTIIILLTVTFFGCSTSKTTYFEKPPKLKRQLTESKYIILSPPKLKYPPIIRKYERPSLPLIDIAVKIEKKQKNIYFNERDRVVTKKTHVPFFPLYGKFHLLFPIEVALYPLSFNRKVFNKTSTARYLEVQPDSQKVINKSVEDIKELSIYLVDFESEMSIENSHPNKIVIGDFWNNEVYEKLLKIPFLRVKLEKEVFKLDLSTFKKRHHTYQQNLVEREKIIEMLNLKITQAKKYTDYKSEFSLLLDLKKVKKLSLVQIRRVLELKKLEAIVTQIKNMKPHIGFDNNTVRKIYQEILSLNDKTFSDKVLQREIRKVYTKDNHQRWLFDFALKDFFK